MHVGTATQNVWQKVYFCKVTIFCKLFFIGDFWITSFRTTCLSSPSLTLPIQQVFLPFHVSDRTQINKESSWSFSFLRVTTGHQPSDDD